MPDHYFCNCYVALRRTKRVDLKSVETKDCNSSECVNNAGIMHLHASKYILYKILYTLSEASGDQSVTK